MGCNFRPAIRALLLNRWVFVFFLFHRTRAVAFEISGQWKNYAKMLSIQYQGGRAISARWNCDYFECTRVHNNPRHSCRVIFSRQNLKSLSTPRAPIGQGDPLPVLTQLEDSRRILNGLDRELFACNRFKTFHIVPLMSSQLLMQIKQFAPKLISPEDLDLEGFIFSVPGHCAVVAPYRAQLRFA